MVKYSVSTDSQLEIDRFKWIESEKAGYDVGESAARRWIKEHWSGYLRARWLEHIQGRTFWIELDRGDYRILLNSFHDNALLLDRIVDRLKAGQENLHVILWASTGHPDVRRSRHSRIARHQQPPPIPSFRFLNRFLQVHENSYGLSCAVPTR